MLRHVLRPVIFIALCLVLGLFGSAMGGTKNVIFMLGDAAGHNTFDAARFWEGSPQVYDGPGWVYNPVSTYELRKTSTPLGLTQDPFLVYDPAKNWDTTPVGTTTGGFLDRFAGYKWNKDTLPDSAATATALSTGTKTYQGAINVDGNQAALASFAQLMKGQGKSVGSISSVFFSHATPAAMGGAHNVSRGNLEQIANEMLSSGVLDVIMGPGNPGFDDNGVARTPTAFDRVGGSTTWSQLEAGTHAAGWTLVEDKASIEALMTGTAPSKLLVVPQVAQTLQEKRTPVSNIATATPGQDAFISTVPTLETMTKVALNSLDNNPDGFFLAIEGGAVDWAMHDQRFGRTIEEMMDFNRSVEAVASYLDANTNGNNWDNTLVIVTADHDHLLLGPDSDTIAYQPVQDNGAGVLPGYKWQYNSHSNQLVPSYARGLGAGLLTGFADQLDFFDDGTNTFGRGLYLDQTEIFQAMNASLLVPEPSSLVHLLVCGVGLLLVLGIRRRK